MRYLFSQIIRVNLILRKRKTIESLAYLKLLNKKLHCSWTGDKLESNGYKNTSFFFHKQAYPITDNIIVMYILLIKLRFSSLRHRWPYPVVAILFRFFGFIAHNPTIMDYLAFKSFDFGWHRWWRFF